MDLYALILALSDIGGVKSAETRKFSTIDRRSYMFYLSVSLGFIIVFL